MIRSNSDSPRSVHTTISFQGLTALLLLSFSVWGSARGQQSSIAFERISLQQGLSQSIVSSIVQDKRGFLWFATEDGLNLYDGYVFTVMRNSSTDPYSLSQNEATVLCEDRSGTLWVGTFAGGLNRYLPGTQRFIRYRHSPFDSTTISNDIIYSIYQDRSGTLWVGTAVGLNKVVLNNGDDTSATFVRFYHDPKNPGALSNDAITCLFQDREGTLWIGTGRGLNCLTPDELTKPTPRFAHYRHNKRNPRSLSNDRVRAIYEDRSGTLWIGTDGGLNRVIRRPGSPGALAFQRYVHNPRNPRSIRSNEVYAILEDSSGAFWVGTNGGGLNAFDRTTETFVTYQRDPRDATSISDNQIRCLFQDRSEVIWVGTYGGGANKVDVRKRQFVHYQAEPDKPTSLTVDIIWSIYEDRKGTLWLGTHGGGLSRFDRRRNRFTYFRSDPRNPNSLSHNVVRLVVGDPSGDLWIGTNGGGVCRFNPETERFTRFIHNPRDTTSLSHDEIRAFLLDRQGALWIGTYGGGLNRLEPRTGSGRQTRFTHYRHDPNNPNSIGSDYIRAIHEDRSGILWIGTHGAGLDRFDRATGTIKHFRSDPRDPQSLSNDYIFHIHEDKFGVLWLTTWGGGLIRFDPATSKCTILTEEDGLPGNAVYGILEDRKGNFWLSTNNGLSRFNPEKRHFKNYTPRDGLQAREFNAGSFFKSPRGEMFFGGINGFNSFFPEKIKDNPYIPPVVLTAFSKLNEPVDFGKPLTEVGEIKLSHKDYFFEFEFAALDYTAPEENLYAYKMEGLDEEWIRTTAAKRYASYTTLSPGAYTFRVIGSNSDGVWNKTGVSINVMIAPPFWKTWWFILICLVVAVALLFLAYHRRLRTVRMSAELRAAHDAQMSIMPHDDPKVNGYDISGTCLPANEVGGDFFDYFWFDEKQKMFGVVLGDVSGKAMKAAMTAVMASGMISAEIADGSPITEVLRKANRLLYPKTDREIFTAVCLCALDTRRKRLTFANAGLNKPLLKSQKGVTSLEAVGSTHPLGILRESKHRERVVQLRQGDVIILQTDGIVEAQDRDRNQYSEERLKRLLEALDTRLHSAQSIRDTIVRDVQRFSASATQHDDMALVVIKVL